MGVNPHAPESLGVNPLVHQLIEQIGDRRVVEGDGHRRTALFDGQNVDDQQGIDGVGQAEAADFGFTPIAEIDQFGPGIGTKPQGRTRRRPSPATPTPIQIHH